MARPRLTKGDITIAEVLELSRSIYKKDAFDNKAWRANLDVINGKMIKRNNLEYNRKEQKWEQTGRETKFVFLVKTNPISYTKTDAIPIHKYPVTILMKEFDKGIDSPFKWREGSNFKPIFPKKKLNDIKKKYNEEIEKLKEKKKNTKNKKEKIKIQEKINKKKEEKLKKVNKTREKNQKIINRNIRRGIQLQFFFDMMKVANIWGLLVGPDYTNAMPKKTNPSLTPFFGKHAYFIITKILIPLLDKKFGFVKGKVFKSKE